MSACLILLGLGRCWFSLFPHWCLTAIVVVVSPLVALMEARRCQGKWGPCSGRRARTLARNGRSVAKKAIRVLASLPKFRILLDNVGAIRTHVGADWEHLLQAAHFLSAFLLKEYSKLHPGITSPMYIIATSVVTIIIYNVVDTQLSLQPQCLK